VASASRPVSLPLCKKEEVLPVLVHYLQPLLSLSCPALLCRSKISPPGALTAYLVRKHSLAAWCLPCVFMLVQYHRLPLGWVIRIRPSGIDQMAPGSLVRCMLCAEYHSAEPGQDSGRVNNVAALFKSEAMELNCWDWALCPLRRKPNEASHSPLELA